MNYLEHHLGDYALRSRSFSMLEHGAYAMLRDRYFDTEKPIPAVEVYRQACARSKDERAAVDVVLAEFYALDGDAWRCAEFDAQIVRIRAKIEAAKENGKKGGRPPRRLPERTHGEPNGNPVGLLQESKPKALQTPDTRHQLTPMTDGENSATVAPASTDPPARDGDPPKPSEAGRACLLCRGANVHDVNPAHPDLLRLLAAGVTPEDIGATAAECVSKGKGRFAYVLATVERRRVEAAAAPSIPAAKPATVPADDKRADDFLNALDQRAKEATKPPPALKALIGRKDAA